MRIYLIVITMVLTPLTAIAGQVTIPNTFVTGTPARASEVNANFTAVKSAVDDNYARSTSNAAAITSEVTRAKVVESANVGNIATNMTGVSDNYARSTSNAAAIISEVTRAKVAESANVGDIATNTASITNNAPIRIKANGVTVATFLSANLSFVYYSGITKNGYLFVFDVRFGEPSRNNTQLYDPNAQLGILHTNADCTGVTYAGMFPSIATQGAIIATGGGSDPIAQYYAPKNSTSVIPPATVYSNIGNCTSVGNVNTNSNYSIVKWYQVYPNDPAVTGITFPLSLPITIGQ